MEGTKEEHYRERIETLEQRQSLLESQLEGFDKKIIAIAEDHAEHLRKLYELVKKVDS